MSNGGNGLSKLHARDSIFQAISEVLDGIRELRAASDLHTEQISELVKRTSRVEAEVKLIRAAQVQGNLLAGSINRAIADLTGTSERARSGTEELRAVRAAKAAGVED